MTGMLILALLNQGLANADTTETNAAVIEVHAAYLNATIADMTTTAAYMHLVNPSDKAIRLVGVDSALAPRLALHQHRIEAEMRVMRAVQSITIPAGGMTTLKPGGYHIMLMGLQSPIAEGATAMLNLQFGDGSVQPVKVSARKPGNRSVTHKRHSNH